MSGTLIPLTSSPPTQVLSQELQNVHPRCSNAPCRIKQPCQNPLNCAARSRLYLASYSQPPSCLCLQPCHPSHRPTYGSEPVIYLQILLYKRIYMRTSLRFISLYSIFENLCPLCCLTIQHFARSSPILPLRSYFLPLSASS